MTNLRVVELTGPTFGIKAEQVLQSAFDKSEKVMISGPDINGNEYFESSMADMGHTIWHLERCKHFLLTQSNREAENDG